MSNLQISAFKGHPLHLVSPSPWLISTCISLLKLTTPGVLTVHSLHIFILLLVSDLSDDITSLVNCVTYFYSTLTIVYVIKLLLKSLILRSIIYFATVLLLWTGFIPLLAINAIILIFLFLYYRNKLLKLCETMPLFNATVMFTLTFIFLYFLGFMLGFVFLIFIDLSLFFPDVVFILGDGDSSSNSGSDSGSSNNGSSPGGPQEPQGPHNEIGEGDVPDVGPRAECEHPSWIAYPIDLEDTQDTVENCDFGGTPRADGSMQPHSAMGPSHEMPLVCSTCHAIICSECASPEDYAEAYHSEDHYTQAGPSVEAGPSIDYKGGIAEANEDGEDTNLSKESHANAPQSSDDYTGKGKGKR